MPRGRRRRTQSGDPAQNVGSVPGQRYGEGPDQQQLQATMPAPDRVEATEPSAAPVQPAAPTDPSVIQDFLSSSNPNMLGGTQLPDQPVTEGLTNGPGRGPAAISGRPATPIARYLARLSDETGNPKWKRLAERAGL